MRFEGRPRGWGQRGRSCPWSHPVWAQAATAWDLAGSTFNLSLSLSLNWWSQTTPIKALLAGLLMTSILFAAPTASADDPPCTPQNVIFPTVKYCTATWTGATIHESTVTFAVATPGDDAAAWLVPVLIVVEDPLTGQELLNREGYCLSFHWNHDDCSMFTITGAGQALVNGLKFGQATVHVKAYYLGVGYCVEVGGVPDCSKGAIPVAEVPFIDIDG